jgi:hypothetical protein
VEKKINIKQNVKLNPNTSDVNDTPFNKSENPLRDVKMENIRTQIKNDEEQNPKLETNTIDDVTKND